VNLGFEATAWVSAVVKDRRRALKQLKAPFTAERCREFMLQVVHVKIAAPIATIKPTEEINQNEAHHDTLALPETLGTVASVRPRDLQTIRPAAFKKPSARLPAFGYLHPCPGHLTARRAGDGRLPTRICLTVHRKLDHEAAVRRTR
jgi:hypothetical protein